MDSKHYDERVLTTESIRFDDIRPRLTAAVAAALIVELARVAEASRRLDAIKKHLFYGRALSLELAVSDPTARGDGAPAGDGMTDTDLRLLHGLLGLISESAEMIDGLRFGLDGAAASMSADLVNVGEEVGDILWYASVLCNAAGLSLDVAMKKNLTKLQKRYGGSFSADKAIDRDTAAEREILERVD